MPVLPRLETSQSVFSGVPLASQQISTSPADFGGVTAQAAGNFAQGAGNAAANLTEIGLRQQAIQNETDANNQFYKSYFPAVSSLTQGYLKLGGKDAVDQLPQYQQQMEQLREQQRGQLMNPNAQRMFDDVSRRLNMFQMDGMQRHAQQQQSVYEDQTSQGMVDASANLAVQRWNDPNGFNAGLASGVQEIMTHAQYRGEPVEYANAKVSQFTSQLYSKRLQMMAQTDPVGAYDLLRNGESYTDLAGNAQHVDIQDKIGAAQLPSVYDYLLKGAKEVWARDLGQSSVNNGGPSISPGSATLGVRNNNYGNLRDPSTGKFQVFQTPEQGVKAADDNLAAYGSKHGIDTLNGIIARWAPSTDGNNEAAYVMRVSKATGFAPDQKIDLSSPAVRAAILPAMFDVESPGWRNSTPGTGPTTSTHDLAAELPNKVQAARAAAQQMFPNDPAFSDKAAAYAEHAGNTILMGARQQQQKAVDTLTRAMVGTAPDGSDKLSSMDQVMANPALKAAWSQLTPEQQLSMQTRLAKPAEVPLTKDGLNTFYHLRGEAVNNPNAFLKEDLTQLYGKIPDRQIMELISQQSSLAKGDASAQTKSLNWSSTKGDVEDMLRPMGMGTTAKAGSDESKLTSQFYGKLQEQLESYHQQNGKYPDTITTRKLAASLLVQGTQGESSWVPSWLGGGGTGMPRFESPDLKQWHPPQNADGWALHIDARGNMAYVSPDGKNFKPYTGAQ